MLITTFLALAQTPLAPDTLEPGVLAGFDGAKFGDTIDIDGGTALITAPVTFEGTSLSGIAYTYEYTGGAWQLDQRLDAPGYIEYQDFGTSAALSGDIAVVASRYMDTASGNNSGGAVVYERQAGVWTQTAELLPPAGADGDLYGYGVDVEGGLAVLGSNTTTLPFLVYERQPDASWTLVQEVFLMDSAFPQSHGGAQPRIQGETLYLPYMYASISGSFQGEIQVFERGPAGWTFDQRIRNQPLVTNSYLGRDFEIDGDILVASSPFVTNPGPGSPAGRVFVFERSGGNWTQVQTFGEPLANEYGRFGDAVTLSGNRLLVGAPTSGGGSPGIPPFSAAVYTYERIDGDFTLARVTLDPAGIPAPYAPGSGVYGTYFGNTLALAGDRALIGAPFDDAAFLDAGEAYAFDLGRLATDVPAISLLAGGAQQLSLFAGPTYAGLPHVLLGSASGTVPGLVLDGVPLPLNPDGYLVTSVTPGSSPLTGNIGVLDTLGQSRATLSVPPGLSPSLAGRIVHHAYVVIDPSVPAVVAASEADPIELLP